MTKPTIAEGLLLGAIILALGFFGFQQYVLFLRIPV